MLITSDCFSSKLLKIRRNYKKLQKLKKARRSKKYPKLRTKLKKSDIREKEAKKAIYRRSYYRGIKEEVATLKRILIGRHN